MLDEASAIEGIARGEHRCHCGGRLQPWGYARVRQIRRLDGSGISLRPRRLVCTACRRTQVLLPAWSLPRRRDSSDSIGAALLMAAKGNGHRTIAADLGRPESTVRNWLRRFRQQVTWLHDVGVLAVHELDPGHSPMTPRATPLAGAVDILGYAALAASRRFGLVHASPWSIIATISRGILIQRVPDG